VSGAGFREGEVWVLWNWDSYQVPKGYYPGKEDESTGGSRESRESMSYQCAPFHSEGDMKCMFISGKMG
jgi:predicted NUDIX family NTP pyrophosphohydrolase